MAYASTLSDYVLDHYNLSGIGICNFYWFSLSSISRSPLLYRIIFSLINTDIYSGLTKRKKIVIYDSNLINYP